MIPPLAFGNKKENSEPSEVWRCNVAILFLVSFHQHENIDEIVAGN
jgi:hypothetical protein